MYGALAEAVADAERRIWHRAMATVGYDEEVAVALERHAVAARRRGAVMVAAAALERAAALTADPQRRGERLVRAADAAYELGAVDVVRRLLEQAEPLDVGELEAARLAWLQQMISGDVWFERGAAKTFVTIARRARDAGDADTGAGLAGADRASLLVDAVSTEDPEVRRRCSAGDGVPEDDPRLLAVMALADPEAMGRSRSAAGLAASGCKRDRSGRQPSMSGSRPRRRGISTLARGFWAARSTVCVSREGWACSRKRSCTTRGRQRTRVTGPPPPRRGLRGRGWPGTPISRSMGSRVS